MATVSVAGCLISRLGNFPKNADKSYQYLLLRLLLGTVSVTRNKFTYQQKTDNSSLPATQQTKTAKAAIADFLSSYAVGGDIHHFVKATLADNRNFYHEVLGEFLNYYVHFGQGRHTSAFIFLYRILERISYTVPLLYAATQKDYIGTFKDLKAILAEDQSGELGLFKKFLSQGRFIDPIKLQVNQKLSFASLPPNGAQYYLLITKHYPKFAATDQANSEVEITLKNIPEFLITMRNRFFHSRTGDGLNNIKPTELPDSDELFSIINPPISNFLALVVLQTFASKYQA